MDEIGKAGYVVQGVLIMIINMAQSARFIVYFDKLRTNHVKKQPLWSAMVPLL